MRTFVRYDDAGNIVATVQVATLPRGREHPWVDLQKGEQVLEVPLPPDAGFNDLRQIHRGKVDVKTKQVVPLDKAGKGKAEKTRKAKGKAKAAQPKPKPRIPPIRPPSGFPSAPAPAPTPAPAPGGAAGSATPASGGATGSTPRVVPGGIASRVRKPAAGETPPTRPEEPEA